MTASTSDRWQLLEGRCEEVLATMPDNSVDSIVTDAPYELGFMGKHWDASGIAYSVAMWREALRVLKPGGYLLAFGGTRTYHRMAVAIEDAGFLIRDSIHWLYGSGFPKSLNISKALDKDNGKAEIDLAPFGAYVREMRQAAGMSVSALDAAMGTNTAASWWEGRKAGVILPSLETYQRLKAAIGMDDRFDGLIEWAEAEREIVGRRTTGIGAGRGVTAFIGDSANRDITAPATEAAILWEGYGTALKPAHEPIVVAQKPLSGTYAANVIEWGCGALNIDGCRVGYGDKTLDDVRREAGSPTIGTKARDVYGGFAGADRAVEFHAAGRWPTNLVLTHSADCGEECAADCPVALLDRQSGNRKSGWRDTDAAANTTGRAIGQFKNTYTGDHYGDTGGASRFYPAFRYEADDFAPFLYCAKPSKAERNAGLASLPIVTAAEMTGRKEGSAGLSNPRAGTSPRTGAANHHPTVKPIALMRWLVRLVTPHGGTTLDLFAGSGTTVAAAIREGKRAIAIEMTPEYWPIIRARAAHHEEAARIEAEERAAEVEREARRGRQMTIFDVLPATVEPERVEGRCFTCRVLIECERDEITGEIVCHVCRGERHRRHHAAWLARVMAEYQEGEDDGIDF